MHEQVGDDPIPDPQDHELSVSPAASDRSMPEASPTGRESDPSASSGDGEGDPLLEDFEPL